MATYFVQFAEECETERRGNPKEKLPRTILGRTDETKWEGERLSGQSDALVPG